MSHHHHHTPLERPEHHTGPAHSNATSAENFIAVAGRVSGPLGDADDNHVEIKLLVSSGQGAGKYKVEFNVESNSTPKDAKYFILDQPIGPEQMPHEGVDRNAKVDYKALGLKETDFKIINNGKLRTIVHSSVEKSLLVVAYGFTFPGNGVHMIHFNNGEKPGRRDKNHPGHDGALAVYFRDLSHQLFRRWIFLKFQSQSL